MKLRERWKRKRIIRNSEGNKSSIVHRENVGHAPTPGCAMITLIMRERITVSIRERRAGETTARVLLLRKRRNKLWKKKEKDKEGEERGGHQAPR